MKKLRRLGIPDSTAGNAFLDTTYLREHNDRFGQAPASAGDFIDGRRVVSRSITWPMDAAGTVDAQTAHGALQNVPTRFAQRPQAASRGRS